MRSDFSLNNSLRSHLNVCIQAFGTNASKAACKNTAARQVIDAVKKVVEHLNKSNVMKVRETNMNRLTFVRSNVNDNFNLQCCTEKPHSHVPTCFFTSGVLVVSLLFRSPKATDAVCYRATYCCGDWFQKVCLREVKFSLERG